MMGSGARIIDSTLGLATPSHMLDPLYLVMHGETFHVSNSLAFMLVALALKLDPAYLYCRVDLVSSRLGLDQFVRDGPQQRMVPTSIGSTA